jgi:recombination protein RecR
MNFSSSALDQLVNQFAQLPGIGKRSALRFALFMLRQPKEEVLSFANALSDIIEGVKYCKNCHNISDSDICNICNNPKRDHQMVCIVQDIRDVIAIENTMQFNGVYHVLGGLISPLDGIGPENLTVNDLVERIKEQDVKEIILALNSNIEGDTTNFYIARQIKNFELKVSTIARGLAVGDELEYADEITLGRSLMNRIPFQVN